MPSSELLPEYSVRTSRRARRIGLRVLPGQGLEIVLPPHADPACVPEIVRRHRRWIDKALLRMSAAAPTEEIPREFTLAGGRERVVPRPAGRGHPCAGLCALAPGSFQGTEGCPPESAGSGLSASAFFSPVSFPPASSARAVPDSVVLFPAPARSVRALQTVCAPCVLPAPAPGGPVLCRPLPVPEPLIALPERAADLRVLLREWVRREARVRLSAVLWSLANQYGFERREVSVRFQRTRWGSCPRRGNINLNACLIFLPERLARHIVLHELCHTRHMNHGEGFWKLLFSLEPDALARDRDMRGAWRHVPAWVLG